MSEYELTMKIGESSLTVITSSPGQYVGEKKQNAINVSSNHWIRTLA